MQPLGAARYDLSNDLSSLPLDIQHDVASDAAVGAEHGSESDAAIKTIQEKR